jgi:hypothetical protein
MKRQLGQLFKAIDQAQTKLEDLEQKTSAKLQSLRKKIQQANQMNIVKYSDTRLVLHWQFVHQNGKIKFLGNRPSMIREITALIEDMESGENVFITGLRQLTILDAPKTEGFNFQMPNGVVHHVKLEKLEYMPMGTANVPVVGYYQPFAD